MKAVADKLKNYNLHDIKDKDGNDIIAISNEYN